MKKKYDYIVYIGRFQPYHIAHENTIKKALQLADKVLVLIGSSVTPRTTKNPFTYPERREMIRKSLPYGDESRVIYSGIPDYDYNDQAWIAKIGDTIKERTKFLDDNVAFIGHDKDESSYYLNYFPQYKFIDVPQFPSHGATIDATKVRTLWYEGHINFVQSVLPPNVYATLEDISLDYKEYPDSDHSWYKDLIKEHEYTKAYKASWAGSPFPPQFVTVDAVVVQSGHVLLVERGGFPCKGQWAMAGGFVDEKETMENAVYRELVEETTIKLPEKMLKRVIQNSPTEFFSQPNRSSRGRGFTLAYLIQLNDDEKLPAIKGADDANQAKWIPISQFKHMQNVMFEDHFAIVNKMLSKMK